MPVRKSIPYNNGVYFITFTCANWLPLFKMCNAYHLVYKWFDLLKSEGHHVIGYVIMPHHLHAIIAFKNSNKSINGIVGNGKRFMAYGLVDILKTQEKKTVIAEMQQMVNDTDKKRNKIHEVFEPSFDWKECRTAGFIQQKLNYVHANACKCNPKLAVIPEEYHHSSATFYLTGNHAGFPVTSFMALADLDLGG